MDPPGLLQQSDPAGYPGAKHIRYSDGKPLREQTQGCRKDNALDVSRVLRPLFVRFQGPSYGETQRFRGTRSLIHPTGAKLQSLGAWHICRVVTLFLRASL